MEQFLYINGKAICKIIENMPKDLLQKDINWIYKGVKALSNEDPRVQIVDERGDVVCIAF